MWQHKRNTNSTAEENKRKKGAVIKWVLLLNSAIIVCLFYRMRSEQNIMVQANGCNKIIPNSQEIVMTQ